MLAADRAAVSDAYDRLFTGSLRSMSFGATDQAGWVAGADAGESARLSADEVGRRERACAIGRSS